MYSINEPSSARIHPMTGDIYVTSNQDHSISRISAKEGAMEVLVGTTQGYQDGSFKDARFNKPVDIAFNSDGSLAFVSEWGNHCIRLLDLSKQTVGTFAGKCENEGSDDGTFDKARFRNPQGLLFVEEEAVLYVADRSNNKIRAVSIANQNVTTYAGDGVSGFLNGNRLKSRFNIPLFISRDLKAGSLYISDIENSAIRKIQNDSVSTFSLRIPQPFGVSIFDEKLFVTARESKTVYLIDLKSGVGMSQMVLSYASYDIRSIDATSEKVVITDFGANMVYVIPNGGHTVTIEYPTSSSTIGKSSMTSLRTSISSNSSSQKVNQTLLISAVMISTIALSIIGWLIFILWKSRRNNLPQRNLKDSTATLTLKSQPNQLLENNQNVYSMTTTITGTKFLNVP